MGIVKNPAYLRFVKYEHWLAFAGIGVLILQLILKFFRIQSTEIIICCILFILNAIPVLQNSTSFHFHSKSRTPAILLLLTPILLFYFNVTTIVCWLLISELFWRGTYFELLKRQGFSNYVIILITSIASICFYLLLFPVFNLVFASAILVVIIIAGILRSKGDITTVFAFYTTLFVVSLLLLGFFFPNLHE